MIHLFIKFIIIIIKAINANLIKCYFEKDQEEIQEALIIY